MSFNFETFHKTFKDQPEQLNQFLVDLILKRLNLEIPFENKYKSLIDNNLLIEFVAISDIILNYSLKFLGRNNVNLEEEFPFTTQDTSFVSNLYHFILINYEKLNILKIKEVSLFSPNTLTGFNVNLQVTFSHHNYGIIDEPSALIQLYSQSNNKVDTHCLELNETELDQFIQKLKEIQKKLI